MEPMIKKTLFRSLMIFAATSLLLTSCKKEEDQPVDQDTSVASDNSLAEQSYDDAQSIADEASTGSLSSYFSPVADQSRQLLSACATVTHDTMSTPRTITINFGNTNCLCNDGRYRRGIINVSYTGAYRDSLSTHTITFTNYYVNDNQIMGTKTVTNNGHNSSGYLSYAVNVNGQIIKADGGIITWTSARTRQWILGESTPTWSDDVYLISGSGSGTNASGNSFTMSILTSLRKEIGCRHFVSGTLTITPSGKPVRTVDFGTGACDNQATVTINSHVYNITLH
jgi:hypothetical protein